MPYVLKKVFVPYRRKTSQFKKSTWVPRAKFLANLKRKQYKPKQYKPKYRKRKY